jgi:hypothetical protein
LRRTEKNIANTPYAFYTVGSLDGMRIVDFG